MFPYTYEEDEFYVKGTKELITYMQINDSIGFVADFVEKDGVIRPGIIEIRTRRRM